MYFFFWNLWHQKKLHGVLSKMKGCLCAKAFFRTTSLKKSKMLRGRLPLFWNFSKLRWPIFIAWIKSLKPNVSKRQGLECQSFLFRALREQKGAPREQKETNFFKIWAKISKKRKVNVKGKVTFVFEILRNWNDPFLLHKKRV